MKRLGASLALVALTGCGRVGFDRVADAGPPDAGVSPYAMVVLSDDPVAYYRLSDLGGPAVRDSSSHANDGVLHVSGGSVGFGEIGALRAEPDTAMRLEGEGNPGTGSGAYVETPGAVAPFVGDFTIECWLRPLALPFGGYSNALYTYEDHTRSGFRTGWNVDLHALFWTSEGGGRSDIASNGIVSPTGFTHVVFVRRGAELTIYLDGVADITAPLDMVEPTSLAERGFGAFHGMPSSAVFDEVAIYGVALPAARVGAHYAAGRAP